MGAFSAPLACAQVPVERHTLFFHDLPPELAEIMRADDSDAAVEGPAAFDQPWPLAGWPDVPTTVLSGRDDRLFPLDLQRRVSRQLLGLEVEELPGGHLLALSQPSVLAEHLTSHS
jgi:pimeloyl-ACP methyl ester carboxylesterase